MPEWLKELRRSEITHRVKGDGDTLLGGIDFKTACEATGWGQGDFNKPWVKPGVAGAARRLEPEDLVLLYAHIYQPRHLEELLILFEQELFGGSERPQNPIVVDVGCGPFTGGLAIMSQFPKDAQIDYIGVDRSRAMRRLGERLASAAGCSGTSHDGTSPVIPTLRGCLLHSEHELPQVRCRWAADVPSVSWNEDLGQRPVIVIVSYLLASPTLDVAALVPELDCLLAKLGSGSVTVLYTNSNLPEPNRKLREFSKRLCDRGFSKHADEERCIDAERGDDRRFWYALFERPAQ